MKVTSERLEHCQVRVTVELEAAEVETKLRRTAQEVSRKYTIPGYRKGKAPYAAVLRTFGRELLQQQALEDWGQDLYDDALSQVEYEPYDQGELENVAWDPFVMNILLPIRPEVDLGDYRSVRLEDELQAVTDEDVEHYLEELRQQNAQWVPVERAAVLGDRVVVDIEGKVEGEVVLGNQGRELILSAEARYPLPGLHEQVVGMVPGETKIFPLTYPDNEPQKELAGKEATFSVHLVTVNEQDIPALDDELALMVGDYETLDDLRASVRKNLGEEAKERQETEFPDKVLAAMIEQAPKVEFPPQAVSKEVESMLDQVETNLSGRGVKLETYLTMMGKTRQAYSEELRPAATERVRRRFVMSEIIRREGLTVSGDEVQAALDRLAASEEFQTDEMQQLLQTPGARISVMNDLLVERARERVAQIARGEAPEPAAEEAAGQEESAPAAEAEAEAAEVETPAEAAEGEAAAEASDADTPTTEPAGE